jgi:toxin FitB
MYLVDTNVISELRKRHRAEPAVIRWFRETPEALMMISVVTVAELEAGVQQLERRDAVQGALIRRWVDGVMREFGDRCVSIEVAAGRICGGLHVPDPRPERDAWIAATALARGLTVVTRNTRDFLPMGVKVLNPWEV